MSSSKPHQTHRVMPLQFFQPSELILTMSKSHRYKQEDCEYENELVEQLDSTQRQIFDESKEYSHQIDAIFTQLQDELISVKSEFCRRVEKIAESKFLNDRIKNAKMQEEISTIKSILKSFKEVHRQFMEEQFKIIDKSNKAELKSAQSFDQRFNRRVSEAMVEMSGWDEGFNLARK